MSGTMPPLVRRFPALAAVPRVALGAFPTPIERLPGDRPLWVKRDDRSTTRYGGSKLRALEYLLAGLDPGARVLTVGGEGSTHVLATGAAARRLGLTAEAIRWPHAMNDEASLSAGRARAIGVKIMTARSPVLGLLRAWFRRLRTRARYIPLGGSTPHGMLGPCNAGMELAEQVRAGAMPAPAAVVLPLGTGGTVAGISLGLHLGGLETTVVAVRVGPRLTGRWLVNRRQRELASLLHRLTGEDIALPPRSRLVVRHDWSGGAYGRAEPRARKPAEWLRATTGIRLDGTYSAKAFGVAHEMAEAAREPILFWLTFDGRWIEESGGETGQMHTTGPHAAVRRADIPKR